MQSMECSENKHVKLRSKGFETPRTTYSEVEGKWKATKKSVQTEEAVRKSIDCAENKHVTLRSKLKIASLGSSYEETIHEIPDTMDSFDQTMNRGSTKIMKSAESTENIEQEINTQTKEAVVQPIECAGYPRCKVITS